MRRRRVLGWLAALPLGWAGAARAAAIDYPPVLPGRPLVFPRDHGAHPDFRIEWWYVTGWLRGGAGEDLGFQVTFFRLRSGIGEDSPSRFAPRQLLVAHAALSDPRLGRLRHDQRSARTGFGLALAEEDQTRLRLDDWTLDGGAAGYATRIAAADFGLELEFATDRPPLLHGQAGFSRKARDPRHASHYYSRPQLAVRGTVSRDGRREAVRGVAWLDHEWSSELLPAHAVGWDWLGLNLDDGGALMAFRLRDKAGGTLWAAGTLAQPDGTARALGPAEVEFTPRRLWRSPRSGAVYPVVMALRAGPRILGLHPLIDDQELDARASLGALYWEGAVRATGADGREVGKGYLELTGYAGALDMGHRSG